MLFDVYDLVSFASKVMTLVPGDVVLTGTPSGIGPVAAGDTVEVRIEGVGSLTQHLRVASARARRRGTAAGVTRRSKPRRGLC